jgi:hypothetical protein
MLEIKPPLFTMGRIVATSNAINTISQSDIFIGLHRHQTGAMSATKIVRPMTWRW